MQTFLFILFPLYLIIVLLWSIFMLRLKPLPVRAGWLAITIVSIVVGWFIGEGSLIAQMMTLILLIAGACFFTPLRQKFITLPFFKIMKKTLPPISETEMTALKAGDVWWDKELFSGAPDYDQLKKASSNVKLTDLEQEYLDNKVDQLCALVNAYEVRQQQDLPTQAWDYIKEHKFLGMMIPKAYGGLEFSHTAHSLIVSKLVSRSSALGISVMVPNSLGPAELLLKYGTDEQRNKHLTRLSEGKDIPCFSLTSTYAGSDAGSIVDSGIVCEREVGGEKVLGFLMNWEKRYITLSPVATLIGLAFKAYDPDNLLPESHALKGQVELGITCALIPRDTPGVEIGSRHNPLGCAFMNGPNRGKDVFIPMEAIIGGVDMIGEGWRMLMECLAIGRGISLPSTGNTTCQHSLLLTSAYANTRQQFGVPIAKFEGIGEKLSELIMNACRTKANCILTTNILDQHFVPSIISAIVKYRNTELGRSSVNMAMDVHGGRAIIAGPTNYLAEPYIAVPFGITVEGANILTRSLMVFGQGVTRCHPYLFDEINALHHPNSEQGLKDFDQALSHHLSFVFKNSIKLLGVNCAIKPKVDYGSEQTKPHFQQLSIASLQFAMVTDLALLVVGGSLKLKEALSGRFADALSCLYEITAVNSYFDAKEDKDERRALVVNLTTKELFFQFEVALKGVINNFPLPKSVIKILQMFVFGLTSRKPLYDKERIQLANLTADVDWIKATFCEDLYISDDKEDAIKSVLDGHKANQEIQPILDKLKAQNIKYNGKVSFEQFVKELCEQEIITPEEGTKWKETQDKILKVIRVDEFDANELQSVKI